MATATKGESGFPLQGLTSDGWSNEDEATATCACGKVQMVVPLKKPGLKGTFVCHCADCRKVSASMFATNFTSLDSHTKIVRGEDNLTKYSQSETITTGNTMSNYFCKTCGTLMWRASTLAPGSRFMRGGIIDDHKLHDKWLKPDVEIYSEHRAAWVKPVEGSEQAQGMGPFAP